MKVNAKKPLSLFNRTKYFDPNSDRVKFDIVNPNCQSVKINKIKGYEARLYWQFKYCQENDGQIFFYTLTYSDKNIPNKYGVNCFDYEDLRLFLTGGFRKRLKRDYGTIFKYFISAELGEGKGKRGFHNNPHYHLLLFLEPDPDSNFYDKISVSEMRNLIRTFWQGFDQDVEGFHSFQEDCRFGIVKEGRFGDLVKDYRACFYCAKYVTKDVGLVRKEVDIKKLLRMRYRESLLKDYDFYLEFYRNVVYDLYNIPITPDKSKWKYNDLELFAILLPQIYEFGKMCRFGEYEIFEHEIFIHDIKQIICCNHLYKHFYSYLSDRVNQLVDFSIKEWRNRYCNKVRISHGLGDYALKFVDKTNPLIQVPSKEGFRFIKPNLYYYRKLFTKVVKPTCVMFNGCTFKYPNIRVINDLGISYKVNLVKEKIKELSDKVRSYQDLFLHDKYLFNLIKSSDVNTEVFYSYELFVKRFRFLLDNFPNVDIYERYAQFKLVYECRFYALQEKVPDIDVLEDYRRFLKPSYYYMSRSDMRLIDFVNNDDKEFVSYENHPYFLPFIGVFGVFDLLVSYFSIKKDDEFETESNRIREVQRLHNGLELKSYFAAL